MLQLDIWQLAVNHFLPKLFTVDYLKCVLFSDITFLKIMNNFEEMSVVLLNCSAGIRDRTQ